MDFRRGLVSQALMGPVIVIEPEVVLQPGFQLGNRGIVLQVDLFVLDRPPESLNKDVVKEHALDLIQGTAPTIHADAYPSGFEAAGELQSGKLCAPVSSTGQALVGIEDIRPTQKQRLMQSLQAKPVVQSIGQLPGQHKAPWT